jgi:hypothetical protein
MGRKRGVGATSGPSTEKPKKAPHPNSMKNLRPPWKPGESGNPEGRVKTSHEAQTRLRALALADIEAFYTALRANATGGDTSAIRLGIQLAGAMPATEVNVQEKPAGNPYADKPTEELLRSASVSTTLPQ